MPDNPTPRTTVSLARRVIVGVIIVSFGLAAVIGIVVLLGVPLGETTGKVLATTAIVGAFSVAVLCNATLIGRRAQVVGYVGVAVSVVSAALVVWFVWDSGLGERWDFFFRLLWTGVAVSAAFSLASLLLLLADRRRPAVRIALWITLAVIVVALGLTLYITWAREIMWDDFGRLYGIVLILTALGAIVVPVLSLLLPDAGRIGVPHDVAHRLVAEAERRGISVEELVRPLFEPAPAETPAATA